MQKRIESTGLLVPDNVIKAKEEGDIVLYRSKDLEDSYTWNWNNIVVKNDFEVSRLFPYSKPVITTSLDEGFRYYEYFEGNFISFYRVNGKAYVSNEKQVNILDKKSLLGFSKLATDAINEAISSWEYTEQDITLFGSVPCSTFTPTKIEDLCIEGVCMVFLLVDKYNQDTNYSNLANVEEVINGNGNIQEIVDFTPRMYLCGVFELGTEYDENGLIRMLPLPNQVFRDQRGNCVYFNVPRLPELSYEDAEIEIVSGGAVFGVPDVDQNQLYTFLSPQYAYDLELVSDGSNPVQRWSQLMNADPSLAKDYTTILPERYNELTQERMEEISDDYIRKIVETLQRETINRIVGRSSILDDKTRQKVDPIVDVVVEIIQEKYPKRGRVLSDQAVIEIFANIYEYVNELPYASRHNIHSNISRAEILSKKEQL